MPEPTEERARIFQYAVLYHPKPKKDEDPEPSKIIVDLTTVLALNEQMAAMVAARSIPEAYSEELDRCEVAVRPF